jgi:TnpA family transposase
MDAQTIDPTQRRLKILTADEIDALYGRPTFTPDERMYYFALSQLEQEALQEFRAVKAQVAFIVQLGYFKAKHVFVPWELTEAHEDLAYVLASSFPTTPLEDRRPLNKRTRLKQHHLILALCHYRSCDAPARQLLAAKARHAATVSAKPVYIFQELLHSLDEHRIVAPGYSCLQELVSTALTEEQHRVTTIVRRALTVADREALEHLLEEGAGLYALTQLKREPKDFSAGAMKHERQRGEQLHGLYRQAQQVLPQLHISPESIKYYASLVMYYSVYRLKRFDVWLQSLYLLCFVSHRYQRFHDHVLDSRIHHVRQYLDAAHAAAKDRVYTARMEGNEHLAKAGHVLKLFTDERIAPQTPFQDVQATAFGILERQQLDMIADQITTQGHFDETAFQWDHIDGLAPQFKRHLRPVLLAVDFAAPAPHSPLLEPIQFLQTVWRQGRSLGQQPTATVPLRWIPAQMKRYLYTQEPTDQKRLRPDRYEFLVYLLLRRRLESGDIFCRDSVRFRSFEDDLLDDQRWQEQDTLIAGTGLPLLQQPIEEQLAGLEQHLERRLVEVNQRIASGDKAYVHSTHRGRQGRWTVQYPKESEPVNHALFDTLRQIDIRSVLHFVNRHCPFLDAFDHVLGRYIKQEADDRVLIACLIAWATNMGLGRMGAISDLSYQRLAATSESFLRLETLGEANDRLSNAIAALPIFRQYDLGDTLHSSSDGQKFETRLPTINARYSPKYFGLHKGVVSYSLVANHVPVYAQIIGANEHESHYVLDALLNNTTDIQPTVHSTDTHGTNAVNFALLHLFGYQFAPRYRDLYDTVRTSLYGFRHPSQYGEVLLKPVRKINPRLIIEEWPNLLRIFVSLALKTTTQSIIVGKLNAYARKNKTRRALWEYDHIIRSIYLLDYFDSPPLRQHVQRALNRGESYHQLRRAVSYANFGKLRFKAEQEQQLWGECARLLTNCIIYYNMVLLSQLAAHKERAGDVQGAALLVHVSPVAWQHINFYGRYEFSTGPEAINLEEIIQELAQVLLPPGLANSS